MINSAAAGDLGLTFRTFLEARAVVPSTPPGRVAKVGVRSEAPPPSQARRNGVSGLGLFIQYVDREGQSSARRIACRSYDPGHDAINAWCFERAAPRQFRLDRIDEAVCTESGEVFDLGYLLQNLRAKGLPVDDKCLGRVLSLLTFLMRCDGARDCEHAVIAGSVERFALRFDGDDILVEQGHRLAATLAPDHDDFLRTLNWLSRRGNGPRLARFVRDEAARVIDADGSHSLEEIEFGQALGDALTKIMKRA